MRRIVGLILLSAYAVWVAVCVAVFFLSRDAMSGVPLALATVPGSLVLGLLLAPFSIWLGWDMAIPYFIMLIFSALLNAAGLLWLGGLGPFAKRHQTGTKES